mmetsp:Transcript_16978/g.37286  ORF Transcript_16978/g.37286 Transcript_16978/m.37286 type:complete len:292 (-) Transcript_16978:534-1409(-)
MLLHFGQARLGSIDLIQELLDTSQRILPNLAVLVGEAAELIQCQHTLHEIFAEIAKAVLKLLNLCQLICCSGVALRLLKLRKQSAQLLHRHAPLLQRLVHLFHLQPLDNLRLRASKVSGILRVIGVRRMGVGASARQESLLWLRFLGELLICRTLRLRVIQPGRMLRLHPILHHIIRPLKIQLLLRISQCLRLLRCLSHSLIRDFFTVLRLSLSLIKDFFTVLWRLRASWSCCLSVGALLRVSRQGQLQALGESSHLPVERKHLGAKGHSLLACLRSSLQELLHSSPELSS